MSLFVDVHCHLDAFDDPAAIVKRAREAGVKRIVTNGLEPKSNRVAQQLEAQLEGVNAALGLYPTDALKLSQQEILDELEYIKKQLPVAIGEVGLDYVDDSEKDRQKEIFANVLDVAQKTKRPVLVHSRKAEKDVVEMIESFKAKVDLHCFCGSLKLVKKAVDLGCMFSIPATIVRATHFQRLVEEIPLNQLLTETDAPWLSPNEEKNEPKNIPLIVNHIASIKGLTVEDCGAQLWMNATRFLR